MNRKALRDAIDTYDGLLRLHQLNEEFLLTLELSLHWLLEFSEKHKIPIPHREKFQPLLGKVHALITEIASPPFLQHRNRTPEDPTEPFYVLFNSYDTKEVGNSYLISM